MVPMVIHEDAGPITKRSSANCISIAGLLSDESEQHSRFLCATYIKRKRGEGGDTRPMWLSLLGDLEALEASGVVYGVPVAPVAGHAGKVWRFLVLFAKRGRAGEVRQVGPNQLQRSGPGLLGVPREQERSALDRHEKVSGLARY